MLCLIHRKRALNKRCNVGYSTHTLNTHTHTYRYIQHTCIHMHVCTRAHTRGHNVTQATTRNTKITKSSTTKNSKTNTKSDHFNYVNEN